MKPAVGDLDAYRWQPFNETIPFQGVDLSGAPFAMQVRSYRDAPDPFLVSLGNTDSGEGISVSVSTVDSYPTSNVNIQIDETTLEALAFTTPRGGDLTLYYDLVIGAGVAKRRWLEGKFIVHAGATQ